MEAILTLHPMAVAIFVSSWTIGMATMMFPAIVPMVLLYNRMISGSHKDNNCAYGTNSMFGDPKQNVGNSEQKKNGWCSLVSLSSLLPVKTSAFVGTYILVWALTGILLLVFWSVLMKGPFASYGLRDFDIASGVLLVIAGIYQLSPLKKKCLGYCESPLAFFMKRWKGNNLTGGLKMGIYHGMYCLGCCWPYFPPYVSIRVDEHPMDWIVCLHHICRKNLVEGNLRCTDSWSRICFCWFHINNRNNTNYC